MADERSAGPGAQDPEVDVDLDEYARWEIVDRTRDWAQDQGWLCFACGRPLASAGESVVHLVPPDGGVDPVPFVVHGDCAVAVLRSGARLGDWLSRVRSNPATYIEEQIAQVFWGCLKKRELSASPYRVDVGDGPVSLSDGLDDEDGEVGDDLPAVGDGETGGG